MRRVLRLNGVNHLPTLNNVRYWALTQVAVHNWVVVQLEKAVGIFLPQRAKVEPDRLKRQHTANDLWCDNQALVLLTGFGHVHAGRYRMVGFVAPIPVQGVRAGSILQHQYPHQTVLPVADD